ncbi:RnfH family protein [Halomonas piscis]|uniref:UPF0125 protein P1P91_13630 n=1 Tax=Halomonas piscis TaxID=3031727 RepID=A0ABY9YZG4_9GAMM|nr:RnfH family protein [Halomonas piscis]WNK19850.1 RnfH family protein [Halomonas piscis]
MSSADHSLTVEVAFARPEKQRLVSLGVTPGTTAAQAVARADLPALFPEVPAEMFQRLDVGIFGKVLREPAGYRLREGDRVELYRPLLIDPKAARLARAKRQRR